MNWNMLRIPIALTVLLLAGYPASAASDSPDPIEWWTKPSEIRQYGFDRPGRIAKVYVEEGDLIHVGQVLVRQDDRAEREQLEILKVQAEDTTRVVYAQTALDKARVDYEKAQIAYQKGAATDLEVRSAKLEVDRQEASLRLSELEQQDAQASYEQMLVRVDQMEIKSTIDGRVERIMLNEGESAEAQKAVIAVVKLDPLWVELPVPVSFARTLPDGRLVLVEYVDALANDGESLNRAVGKVVLKAGVADSASRTLTVRVEVPNPALRPAGEYVRVSFPDEEQLRPMMPAEAAGESNVDAAEGPIMDRQETGDGELTAPIILEDPMLETAPATMQAQDAEKSVEPLPAETSADVEQAIPSAEKEVGTNPGREAQEERTAEAADALELVEEAQAQPADVETDVLPRQTVNE